MYFDGRTANYDKEPYLEITQKDAQAFQGFEEIADCLKMRIKQLQKERIIVVIDYYHGVRQKEIEKLIDLIAPDQSIFCETAKIEEEILGQLLHHHITDDRVFGFLGTHTMSEFYDKKRQEELQKEIEQFKEGVLIVYGVGASLFATPDVLVYGDLSRWEIQLRYRSGELDNWGVGNFDEDILRKYKRGYFVEWRMLDRHKMQIFDQIDFLLDTNVKDDPKMINKDALDQIMDQFSKQPFRLVPYFDEGIWGGRWMEEVCQLERKENNFAWCFDGVPEENSIHAKIGDIIVEMPAMNLVKRKPKELLGSKVFSRFGAEFPIRFDFLDTMGGGNLSLQVHPLTEYIQQNFGMHYTQDESYYILDADEGACVYLGVKDGVTADQLIPALEKAQEGDELFDAEKYINKIPIKKHDHVLIPAGTIHCSGSDAMVLEISATPYIFTMKLWDWGRVGLDGKPRPVNIERGSNSIQYDRTTKWVKDNLISDIKVLEDTKDLKVEKTGLHELEFIETKRYWFDKKIRFDTEESVNMLNLIEGEEAVITSVDGSFEPYVVHYAETFIVPECVGEYEIAPCGRSENKQIAVIKATVRV